MGAKCVFLIIFIKLNESLTCFQGGSERSETGWIGDGGQPAKPVFLTSGRDYYASFSDDNGYWHIAKVDIAVSGLRSKQQLFFLSN